MNTAPTHILPDSSESARKDAASPDAMTNPEDSEFKVKVLESRIDRLLQEREGLLKQRAAMEKQIREIITSKSWRITEPLRQFTKFRKMILPLWKNRRRECEVIPHTNIIQYGSKLKITGPSAKLSLNLKEGVIPEGWVLFRCRLDLSMIFSLAYRTEADFSDNERLNLSLVDIPQPRQMFYLPPGVKELVVSPFHGEGEFSLSDISLTELGKIQIVGEVYRDKIAPLLRNPRALFSKIAKAVALYRSGGITALRLKLFSSPLTNNYEEWVKRFDTLSDIDRAQIKKHQESFSYKPLISVVMPTYNTPRKWLVAAIESVRSQLYPHWELCIADDASTLPETRQTIREYQAKDSRIKVVFRETNGHISKASNDALTCAEGEFVALLDHDDELTEDALYMVAEALNKDSGLDFIYSDEDKKTSLGTRFNPHFKSNWNPDLFLSQNYICHLGVYRRKIVEEVGGFREGFEGAQDWDLALRISERIPESHIHHIPHVLYHWRVIEGSTAQSTSFKPYVLKAQQRAVSEHLRRLGVPAEVEILESISHVRPKFLVPKDAPLVSIIIPTRDQLHHLSRCIESIRKKTTYPRYEIIIVDNGSIESETIDYLKGLESSGAARILKDTQPFNYSRLNNDAAKLAKGSYLAFLNNDLEVINPEWLSEMVPLAIRKGTGAVGARLLYPNGLLQHAGVIVGIGGVAGHSNKGRLREDPGYFNRAILTQNLTAVTAACVVMSRAVFEEVGGFDDKDLTVAFNDVDLCLKIRSKGYKITYVPYAELYHFESASRGYETTPEKFRRFEQEVENMKRRWREVLAKDPYYNPNLTLITEDFQFAFPPRAEKPWRAHHNKE